MKSNIEIEREIKAQIKIVEQELFYLDMKDRWDPSDYSESRRLNAELRGLKKELKEVEAWTTEKEI